MVGNPWFVVDDVSKLKSNSKIKSGKKSIKFLADKFKEHVIQVIFKRVVIGRGNVLSDASVPKQMLL